MGGATLETGDQPVMRKVTMFNELRRFHDDESGEIVDWAVVVVILLAAAVPVLVLIGDALRDKYCQVLETLGGSC